MIYFEKKLCLLIKFSKEQDFSLDKGFISFFVLFTFRLVTEKHILILYFLKKRLHREMIISKILTTNPTLLSFLYC